MVVPFRKTKGRCDRGRTNDICRCFELTTRPGGSLVAVLDDGEGIPPALQEQVFQPYARAHEAGTQPASVGLGLSIARELARLMGGDVNHTRDCDWTRFELLLPLAGEALAWPKAGAAAG